MLMSALAGCDRAPSPPDIPQSHAYVGTPTISCAAGFNDDRQSTLAQDSLRLTIRAPVNYRVEPHPLLIVYSAAGMTAADTEHFTGLTAAATARGYVLTYVSHLGPSMAAMVEFARVPSLVAAHWCIDPQRIYLTGHSDGGTATTAVALQGKTAWPIAAIAPSAAGFNADDFKSFKCPVSPPSTMVWHGAHDSLFPGWGKEAATWWAGCAGCRTESAGASPNGCFQYTGCPSSAQVFYCETDAGHLKWPRENIPAILDFLHDKRASNRALH